MFDKNILKNELLKFYKNLEIDKFRQLVTLFDVVEVSLYRKLKLQ